MAQSPEVDVIHDALVKLGDAVSKYACAWNSESLVERTNARVAVREAAMALALACSEDEGVPVA